MGGRIDLKSHERLLNEWLMIHFQIITRLLLKRQCDVRLFISFFVLGRPLARVWESWPALTSDRHSSQQALVQPEGNFCSWWFCFLLDHRISRNDIVAGGNPFCKVYPRTHTVFPSSALMACMVGLILFRDTSGLRSILPRPPFSVVRHIYALALVSFYLHHQRCLPRFPPLHRPKSQ